MRHLAIAALISFAAAAPAMAGPRVYALDQCADQYVLALSDRGDIAALSPRADDFDSHLRARAAGLPQGRAGLESILAARPDLVVRYWGGDPKLLAALQRRGVRAVTIDDAQDFDGVRANVRKVAAALGRRARGEALVADMDRSLAAARGAGGGRSALYLTSGGFTAGPDTLIGAMIAAAGYRNANTRPGFEPVSLERMAADPPAAFVLGYFEDAAVATQRWAFGRHRVVRRAVRGRTVAALPASILGCPAWFAADGAASLARAARSGGTRR